MKLYQSGYPPKEVRFPFWSKLLFKFYKFPVPEPIVPENAWKGRKREEALSESFLGDFMYGKKPQIINEKVCYYSTSWGDLRIHAVFPSDVALYNSDEKRPPTQPPIIVYYHGGGYVIGSWATYKRVCVKIANYLGVTVVFPEYRLSPEVKFPGALNDAIDTLHWVAQNGSFLQGDTENVFLMGDSAGGGIAAILALDPNSQFKNVSVKIRGQILLYPWVDLKDNRLSFRLYGKGYGLIDRDVDYFRKCYLNNDGESENPQVSPIHASDFSKAAPALILLGSHDLIRDQGIEFSRKLIEAGISVQMKIYQPTIHGFFTIHSVLPKGKKIDADVYLSIQEFVSKNQIYGN